MIRHFIVKAINHNNFWDCEITENNQPILSFRKEKGLVIDGKINKSYQLSAFGVLRLVHELGDQGCKDKVIVFVKQSEVVDNQFKNWEPKRLERSIKEWGMVSPRLLRWIYLGRAFLVAQQKNIDLEIKHLKELKSKNE